MAEGMKDMLRVDPRAVPEPGSQRWESFKRFRWVLLSTLLLIEVGVFKNVFVRAGGEGAYKAMIVGALGAFLLSLVSTGLRNIRNP